MTTSDDVDGDGDSKDNDANDNDGGDGDNNDGEVEHNGGDDDNNDDNNDDVYIDVVVEDDDNDGTTTMRWQRGQMDDNDAMAMGGQRHAKLLLAPCHPSETTTNLCRQFGEESTEERDNFRGEGRQKRVAVEEIEWRSLHFHSINSKPTFRPPQYIERTGTYFACVLGVRLHYRRHGDHVY
jgi:hypothetical protein